MIPRQEEKKRREEEERRKEEERKRREAEEEGLFFEAMQEEAAKAMVPVGGDVDKPRTPTYVKLGPRVIISTVWPQTTTSRRRTKP